MLSKIHVYAVDGLQTALDAQITNISANAVRIGVIEGDVNTAGSLAKVEADAKAYADAKVGDVDLSQIQTNKTNIATNAADIATLNGDDTVDGSVASDLKAAKATTDAQFDGYKATTDGYIASVTTLNGDSTVPGSVDAKIAAVVDNAPETLDTLKEIADAMALDANNDATLAQLVSDNKTAVDTAIASANSAIATEATTLATINGDDTVDGSTAKKIKDAVAAHVAATANKFLVAANNLSEIDAVAARGNLGVSSVAEVQAKAAEYQGRRNRPTMTVNAGKIVLDAAILPQDIISIRVGAPGSVADFLEVVPGATAGEFTVHIFEAGDLDGQDVTVHFCDDIA
jgi:hypothetical protein